MVHQCHQLLWANRPFYLENNMGRSYLVKRTTSLANSEIKGNVRERLKGCSVKELDEQSVSPYGRGYKCTLLSSFSVQCDSQKLTENMGKVRTLRKSTVSYARACTFCSLSVCLYLSCSLPHTHNCLVAGNVKLLCHVQFQSGGLTTVCGEWACVYVLQRKKNTTTTNTNPKAKGSIGLSFQLGLAETHVLYSHV